MAVLAGADFFTVEVLTWKGLATYYVLFFIQLETRRVTLGGVTQHPTAAWMEQMARNATDEEGGLPCVQYLLHDRDGKFCASFDSVLKAGGVNALKLPARSPNLNAFAERWVRSVKQVLDAEKPAAGRQIVLIPPDVLDEATTRHLPPGCREYYVIWLLVRIDEEKCKPVVAEFRHHQREGVLEALISVLPRDRHVEF
jgi:hypothetical protein